MLAVSTDGGATWSANLAIPKGYPSGANDVKDWRVLASGSDVVVVMAVENDAGGGHEELFLSASIDSGTTFAPAVAVSLHPNGATDVDAMAATMAGGMVHITWQDDVSGVNEGFYSRYDIAAGAFTARDVMISPGLAGGTVENDIAIASNGSTVAIAMQADNLPTSSRHQLNINVSLDGGLTWIGDVQVGGYAPGSDDTDHPTVVVTADGTIAAACEDNRNGPDEVFAYTSLDGGATWLESPSLGRGGYPGISGDGDYIGINWTGPTFPEGSMAAVSRDGGLTWGVPFDMAAGLTGDADFAEMVFNARYGNFVAVWLDDGATGENAAYAGGFRSQTLIAHGPFIAGQPVHFTGTGWGASEAGDVFQVLVSPINAYGTAFLPGDGRDIGIGLGQVLITSRTFPGLSGTVAADGTASTPVFTMTPCFPVGSTLYAMAVSRPLVGFDSLSEAIPILVE
jgi:hypothetical protein